VLGLNSLAKQVFCHLSHASLFSQIVNCYCVEVWLNFIHWFCILQFFKIYFSIFTVFYIRDHVICKDSFTSSFPAWMPLISFSCPVLARTSNTILNRSSKSGLYLVSDLRGKLSSFYHYDTCWRLVIGGLYCVVV
jgi:hypothetical protein